MDIQRKYAKLVCQIRNLIINPQIIDIFKIGRLQKNCFIIISLNLI